MYEKDGEKYFVLDTHAHFWAFVISPSAMNLAREQC
jgi:hypothetical protein